MSDFIDLVANYLAAWNAATPTARAELVRTVFAPDVTYIDPLAEVTGHDGVAALIGGVREQFPGMALSLGGAIDHHHDIARFTWHLGPPGATEPLAVGFDVVQVDGDGLITTVFGFLDRVPLSS